MGEVLAQAGVNAIMGICVVFGVLVIISLIIFCFNLIPKIEAAFAGKSEPAPQASAPSVAAPAAKASDDKALIAVIAAAIAASTGQSTDSFVVRSIKRRF